MESEKTTKTTTVLPLVKAYPALSRKYGEVACVAGIDIGSGKLVRIYPIPFRLLDEKLQFKKYQPIEVELHKRSEDKRPESWKVNLDTLQYAGEPIDSKDDWNRRRLFVEPLIGGSMCDLQSRSDPSRPSLAIIRPREVTDLTIDDLEVDNERKEFAESLAASPTLFEDMTDKALQRRALEQIPYRFKYEYYCEHPNCGGHSQSIIDWEINALFRNIRDQENWRELIRAKWLDQLCGTTRDTAFIVGNHNRYWNTFMVLGVWWPPMKDQLELDM